MSDVCVALSAKERSMTAPATRGERSAETFELPLTEHTSWNVNDLHAQLEDSGGGLHLRLEAMTGGTSSRRQ